MIRSSTFASSLKEGQLGESILARWFIRQGYSVLPAYEIEISHGKGPRVFTASGSLVAPDMIVFNSSRVLWCETKTKSAFTWHRMSRTWQTGIDKRHWEHYKQVATISPWPVWILFLHKRGFKANDAPEGQECPSGLFGNTVDVLKNCFDHEHTAWGPSGMVYWRQESLRKLAEYNQVFVTPTASLMAA